MQRAADPESLPPSTNFTVEDAPQHAAPAARSAPWPPGGKKHPIRTTIIVLVILGLVVAGYFRIQSTRQAAAEKNAGPQRGGMAVPVVAGVAQQKDVPIFLDGLGTIQALNTVTVRARVDGQLESLAIKEGDEVKEGDVIAQLDPAPFQAVLDQALAKQRTDEVQLANARTDLERYSDLVQKKVIAQQQYDTQKALVAQLDATVKNDQAAVQSARVQLAYTRITSPIAGRTGIRNVDVGQHRPCERPDGHRGHHAASPDLAHFHPARAEPLRDPAAPGQRRDAGGPRRLARQQDAARHGQADGHR